MNSLLKVLSKPEYFYNPKQFIARTLQIFKNRPKGEVKSRLFGEDFCYLPNDDIGRALHTFGLYDLCVSEALWRLVEPGATVLDIGANIGYFSTLLSQKVGAHGKVYAFEPNPQILELLKKNIRPRSNIKLLPWALADEDGVQTLFGPKSYSQNKGLASFNTKSGDAIATVDVKRLDDLKLAPTVIKMDVEGHELKVLLGGRATLKNVQHVVFEDHDIFKNGVKSFLEENGFTVFYLLKTFTHLEIQTLESGHKTNPFEPPNYLATRWNFDQLMSAFAQKKWLFLKDN